MFYLVAFGPLIASAVALAVLLVVPSKKVLWVTVGLALASTVWSGVTAWALRDGMGPDATSSSGLAALSGFAEGMNVPVFAAAVVVVAAVTRYRTSRPYP